MNSDRPLAPLPAAPLAGLPIGLAADSVEALHAELGPARPWTYLAILALASAALAALPLVQVDVTVGAPAQVRATSERAEIRAPAAGRIVRLLAADNQPVAAGEVLVELDTTALDARLAHNRARQQHTRDVLQDLARISAAADGVAVFHHLTTSSAAAPQLSAFEFQVSRDRRALPFALGSLPLARPPVAIPSPAAETGAVAAEVSERSAAGAPTFNPVAASDSPVAESASERTRFPTAGGALPPDSAAPEDIRLRTAEIHADSAEFASRHRAAVLAAARAQAELTRLTPLSDQGLVPQRDHDEARFVLARAEAEIDILRQQSLARWHARRRDEELALKALVSEEAHLGDERTSFQIAAPATGTVLGLNGLAEGAWVAAGQPLGVVSPDDDLLVEAAVPPDRIGFIRAGQPVRLAIDTYAATTWGTVGGRVVAVSDDLHGGAQGRTFYRVLIRPDDLNLRRLDGPEAPLRKGMTAQARFIVARRTLLQLLREETSRWLDPRSSASLRGVPRMRDDDLSAVALAKAEATQASSATAASPPQKT